LRKPFNAGEVAYFREEEEKGILAPYRVIIDIYLEE